MDFNKLAHARQSCRSYDITKKVEKEKLLLCVDSALVAPSATNNQPWHYTVVTNTDIASEIAQLVKSKTGMNTFAANAPAFAVLCEVPSNLASKAGGIIKNQDYDSVDIGISAAHFILQAESLGLATCTIGWFNEKKIKQLLDIPSSYRIRLVIAIGYPIENYKLRTKKRKDESETVKFIE